MPAVSPCSCSPVCEGSGKRRAKVDMEQKMGDEQRLKAMSAIKTALACCALFMVAEFIGGYWAHSLAIFTDAAHLLTDVGALALALFSLHAASMKASDAYTFGWHRAEVVGSLGSILTIWALVGIIVVEAFGRIQHMWDCSQAHVRHPHRGGNHDPLVGATDWLGRPKSIMIDNLECTAVQAPMMLLLGILGFAVNMVVAGILTWGGHHHSHGGVSCHGHDGDNGSHHHGHHDHDDASHESHHSHGGDEVDHHDESHHSHGGGDGDHHGRAFEGERSESGDVCEMHQHSHGVPEDPHAHTDDIGGSHNNHGESHQADHHRGKRGGGLALNGAFLHALGDCIQSIGVILSAGFIWYMNNSTFGVASHPLSVYNLADPMSSLIFCVITLWTTTSLLKQLFAILMESAPSEVNVDDLRQRLQQISGVAGVHDLHVWSLSTNKKSLSVHIVADHHVDVLRLSQRVCEDFGIYHTTIQVDPVVHGSDMCCSDVH